MILQTLAFCWLAAHTPESYANADSDSNYRPSTGHPDQLPNAAPPDLIIGKSVARQIHYYELELARTPTDRQRVLARNGWLEVKRPKANLLLNERELGFPKLRAKTLLLRWLATRKDRHYGSFKLSEVPATKTALIPNGLREALLDLFREGEPRRAPYLIRTAKDLRFQIEVNTVLQLEANGHSAELDLTPTGADSVGMVRAAMNELDDPEAFEKAALDAEVEIGKKADDLADRIIVSYAPTIAKPQTILDLVKEAHDATRQRLDELESEQAAALKEALETLLGNSEPKFATDYTRYIGQKAHGNLVGSAGIGQLRSVPPSLDNARGLAAFLQNGKITGFYRTASITLVYGKISNSAKAQSSNRITIPLK